MKRLLFALTSLVLWAIPSYLLAADPARSAAPAPSAFLTEAQILNRAFDAVSKSLSVTAANGSAGPATAQFFTSDQILNQVFDPATNSLKMLCISGCTGGDFPSLDQILDPAADWSPNLGTYNVSMTGGGIDFTSVGDIGLKATALSDPTAPTVTPTGGVGTTWGYTIIALTTNGAMTAPSDEGTTVLGAATLDATNFNTITWAAIPGAAYYYIYRTTAGTSPSTTGRIGSVLSSSPLSLVDDGLVILSGEPDPTILNRNGSNVTGVAYAPSLAVGLASNDSLDQAFTEFGAPFYRPSFLSIIGKASTIVTGLGIELQGTSPSGIYSVVYGVNPGGHVGGGVDAIVGNAIAAPEAADTVDSVDGIEGQAYNIGAGTVTALRGLWSRSGGNFGGGTVTTNYGLQIDDQTSGVTNYAIKTALGQNSFGDRLTVKSNAAAVQSVTFTGAGLNDATSGGAYTALDDLAYCVQIDANGTPDTFEWGTAGSCANGATGVAITGGVAQNLSNGVTILFPAPGTGHTIGDDWTFTAYAPIPLTLQDSSGNITAKVYETGVVSPGILTLAQGAAYGDGTQFECANCDTPLTEGAVCSTGGDGAGAHAQNVRGGTRCF